MRRTGMVPRLSRGRERRKEDEMSKKGRWLLYTDVAGVDEDGSWRCIRADRVPSLSAARRAVRHVRAAGGHARVRRWSRGRGWREYLGRKL